MDPRDRSIVMYNGMKFRIDWETRTWKLEALLGENVERPIYFRDRRYLVGPFVAAEVFQWNGQWWISSTRKEVARTIDRRKGISNHGTVEDEHRNLQGMFLGGIEWDGDFPVVTPPTISSK